MKKKAFWLLSIMVFAIVLAGCGGGAPEKKAEKKPEGFTASNTYDVDLSGVTLNVGAAESKNAHGIVKAAGLDKTPYKVEFHNLRGGNLVLEALAASQIDAGCGSQIPPIFASQSHNGGNFKIVAIRRGTTLNQELLVGPETKNTIKSVSDLKGKKVAYVKNTTAQYFLYKMLEEAGLTWDDVEALPMSTADGSSAVITGDVAAYAGYGTAVMSAKSKGAQTLMKADKILTGDYYWYATPATLKDPAKRAALIDYLERINEADEWARQHPDEWAAYYARETNQDPEKYKKQFEAEENQIKGHIRPLSDATVASEQDIADAFLKLGVLKNPVKAPELFDHSLDAALSKFKTY